MDAKQFADGLREIADWYEAHPDIHLPYDNGGHGALSVFGEPETKERVAAVVRALGGKVEKHTTEASPYLTLSRFFSGVGLRFVFERATVCTARVVGKRTIPAQPAREATPEREEDVIEWDCGPILSESAPVTGSQGGR